MADDTTFAEFDFEEVDTENLNSIINDENQRAETLVLETEYLKQIIKKEEKKDEEIDDKNLIKLQKKESQINSDVRVKMANVDKNKHMEDKRKDLLGSKSTSNINVKTESDNKIPEKYECEICFKSLKTRQILGMHKKLHNQERVNCTECDKTFTMVQSLKRHLLTHSGEAGKSFSCDECGMSFIRSSDVNAHKFRVHSESSKCHECGKSFWSLKKLKTHQVITHGAENSEDVMIYQCDNCGKSFMNSSDLSRHKITHTGERNFTCATCGKAFPQSGHLAGHMRVHSEEKPFGCTICPKKFKTQSTLNRHNTLNRHKFFNKYKSEKFNCDECGFTCEKAKIFSEHLKIHTDEAWNLRLAMMTMDNTQTMYRPPIGGVEVF